MTTDEEAIRKDLGKVLLKLEELQQAAIQNALAPARAEVRSTLLCGLEILAEDN